MMSTDKLYREDDRNWDNATDVAAQDKAVDHVHNTLNSAQKLALRVEELHDRLLGSMPAGTLPGQMAKGQSLEVVRPVLPGLRDAADTTDIAITAAMSALDRISGKL